MMIIDNIKKILTGIFGKKTKQNHDDVTTGRSDNVDETPKVLKHYARILVSHNLSINLLDDDLAEEPMPCVYGPPSWYNENGGLDRNNPKAKKFMSEEREIEEKNILRRELRSMLQDSVDEPIAKVYGPDPTVINK